MLLEQNVFSIYFSSAELDFKNILKILVFVYLLLFLRTISKINKQQNKIHIFLGGGLLECLKIPLKLSTVNTLQVRTLKSNESLYIYYLINKK